MNNPNPFVPKGSLLEQQSQRRSRLKLAVFCVLAISVTGLVATLIQGCKREAPDQTGNTPPPETNMPPLEMTNAAMPAATNLAAPMTPPAPPTNVLAPVPVAPVTPVVPQTTETAPAAGTEYVVVSGDTLAKIAKAHGVTVKALQAANPGVDPKKLKLKQKLIIPAGTTGAAAAPAAGASATAAATTPDLGGGEVYVVKSNDNLSKIAKKHGVSVKALRAANNLTTDHIKVGQKLKIPAKAETAAPAPASVTTPETSAVPVVPPAPVTPATPTPTPTPGH
ncbi:MAG TPA: LysM peptidoglycan-binding domain-containing protein [Verrucomicrobiae bacterium]